MAEFCRIYTYLGLTFIVCLRLVPAAWLGREAYMRDQHPAGRGCQGSLCLSLLFLTWRRTLLKLLCTVLLVSTLACTAGFPCLVFFGGFGATQGFSERPPGVWCLMWKNYRGNLTEAVGIQGFSHFICRIMPAERLYTHFSAP